MTVSSTSGRQKRRFDGGFIHDFMFSTTFVVLSTISVVSNFVTVIISTVQTHGVAVEQIPGLFGLHKTNFIYLSTCKTKSLVFRICAFGVPKSRNANIFSRNQFLNWSFENHHFSDSYLQCNNEFTSNYWNFGEQVKGVSPIHYVPGFAFSASQVQNQEQQTIQRTTVQLIKNMPDWIFHGRIKNFSWERDHHSAAGICLSPQIFTRPLTTAAITTSIIETFGQNNTKNLPSDLWLERTCRMVKFSWRFKAASAMGRSKLGRRSYPGLRMDISLNLSLSISLIPNLRVPQF